MENWTKIKSPRRNKMTNKWKYFNFTFRHMADSLRCRLEINKEGVYHMVSPVVTSMERRRGWQEWAEVQLGWRLEDRAGMAHLSVLWLGRGMGGRHSSCLLQWVMALAALRSNTTLGELCSDWQISSRGSLCQKVQLGELQVVKCCVTKKTLTSLGIQPPRSPQGLLAGDQEVELRHMVMISL